MNAYINVYFVILQLKNISGLIGGNLAQYILASVWTKMFVDHNIAIVSQKGSHAAVKNVLRFKVFLILCGLQKIKTTEFYFFCPKSSCG